MLMTCAHCGREFSATNLNRKYCCNSCNVLASYARNGRPAERAEARKRFAADAKKLGAARLAEAKKQIATEAKKLATVRKKAITTKDLLLT